MQPVRRKVSRLAAIIVIGAGVFIPQAANADTIQYGPPYTVQTRITNFGLEHSQDVHAGCRADAFYGETLWFDRCGVTRRDHHWYGTTTHEMWQTSVHSIVPQQKVIIVTHAGFRCEHGKSYQAWAYTRSTGFFNVVEGDARTPWRRFC